MSEFAGKGGSLPLAPIPLTTPEESEQAQPSPLRSGISATPSAGAPATPHAKDCRGGEAVPKRA